MSQLMLLYYMYRRSLQNLQQAFAQFNSLSNYSLGTKSWVCSYETKFLYPLMCFFSLVPVQIICKNPLYVVFTAILLNSSRMLPSYSFQRVECSKHRNRNRNVEIKSSYYLFYTYISRIQVMVMLALNQQHFKW